MIVTTRSSITPPNAAWTPLLLDTWRQVSEHVDIRASADELWERLRDELPLRRLWVRRLDAGQAWVETVAVSPWAAELAKAPPRHALGAEELRAVTTWVLRGVVEPLSLRLETLLAPADGGGRRRELMVGGLVDRGAPVGVVVLEGDEPLTGDVDLLGALLAPLVVALRNDHRVNELARLREAVEAENRALLSRLARDGIAGPVVGADGGLRDVMARVQRVSQTEAPVLLLGETGTGKELIARELHARSLRARGPFLKVNCGAMPPELIDSELFGHEKGSFTGAIAERRGWFERADGGTLFLDEIGELPAAAQVRLLRVLQDGTFERVGGQRPLQADVRVIAATHRDLREMVAAGRFREDLWYRVAVFPLRLPSLRERMEDLPALAAHFAASAGERLRGRALVPTLADLQLLAAYGWPGNVREVGAVIERAAILGDGQRLDVVSALGVQVDAAPAAVSSVERAQVAGASLEQVNRAAIEAALRRTAGRIEGEGGAAERLGLSPSTLRSRMKRLAVDWRSFRRTDTP